MEINVLFFGVLAEIAETHSKNYHNVESFTDLIKRINDDFPEIVHYVFRIAVNKEIIGEEDPVLKDGDEIAYLPPFAGG